MDAFIFTDSGFYKKTVVYGLPSSEDSDLIIYHNAKYSDITASIL